MDDDNEIQIGKIEAEIEHNIGVIPLVFFFFICIWIGSFDTEIRCSLGSEKACSSLKMEQLKTKP